MYSLSFEPGMLSGNQMLLLTNLLVAEVLGTFLRVCLVNLYSFDLAYGNLNSSIGNIVVPMGGTSVVDRRSMLTINLCYMDAINYELVIP